MPNFGIIARAALHVSGQGAQGSPPASDNAIKWTGLIGRLGPVIARDGTRGTTMRFRHAGVAAVVAALGLAGCAMMPPPDPRPPVGSQVFMAPPPAPEYVIRTSFDEAAFAPYAGRGDANLRGEAYAQLPGGRVVMAADSEVVLVPDTAYTRELLEPAQSGRYTGVANFDPRYFQYRRTARTDGNGAFVFRDIPAGDYIVQTSVVDSSTGQSVFLHRRVTVRQGAGTNVLMTNPV